MSLMDATNAYKIATPLRSGGKDYREDLKEIREASRPLEKAESLVKQRQDAQLIAKVDAMLFDLQGRKKVYDYNNAAAQQLEHIWPTPFDPITQVPLWRDLLRMTNGRLIDRDTFMGFATNILRQFNLYDHNAAGQLAQPLNKELPR